MKHINAFALLIMFVFYASYGRSQTSIPQNSVTSVGPSTMVRNVKQGSNSNILIAAAKGGVLRYDGKTFTNFTGKLGPRRFWNVLEDRRGTIWLATTDSGVYHYNGISFRHFTTREGLAHNTVMVIHEDRAGNIWFGTGGGVSRYDGKTFQNFTTKDGLPNNGIQAIMEDKSGKLWFGTTGEACYYDEKTFTVFRNKEGKGFNNVWSIIEDRKGNIWFGASIIDARQGSTLYVSNGLWRYDGSDFIKVSPRSASAIIEDKHGNIWTTGAASANGVGNWILSRYDKKSLNDKKPAVTEVMDTPKMLCGILEAKDGNIWFGSLSGVYRYDGKTITDFKEVRE
ncbi:ligand-binding sensor domain-containing protein [Mucilaginibacter pedocola]|uniref:Histidine kinase n=1 Tax=Mucilaginibacter pedocola TaxID=1792845 RepID=A0A1S9P6J0_9SPHI|nr:two-component regulator propeller domain-containing protein [Mucilaginibacter pedocola]OOQ56569.1 hypothetical protein BC343_19230 [Mucilaginibacter pedocola]